jgi:hypothetical protein
VRYQAVRWLHELDDEPVLLYSEIDAEGNEVRKVEEYRSGRLDVAAGVTETGSTVLSETPMPSIEEINDQPEFEGRSITKEEFEAVWRRAWEWFDGNDAAPD